MEYAKDLRESSKFIEVSSSLAITGSPFILERDDNIITGSNAGLFIASDGKGFAGTTVKLNMDPKTKEVKFDEYVNKVFTKPVFTMIPISKDGGSLVFNKDNNKVDISCNTECDDCGEQIFECIRDWAHEKVLYEKGDPKTQ